MRYHATYDTQFDIQDEVCLQFEVTPRSQSQLTSMSNVIRIRTAIVYQIHLSPSHHRAKILLLQMLIAFNNMHLMRQLNMEMEEELRMKLWTCSYEVVLSFGNELD